MLIIIIIASFFRLYNITETPPGFYPDEAIYANNGVEAWETGDFKIFYPENNGREGLWPNIIGGFIVKFGHEPWISRSVAAIFGILTVLGTYFLSKELFRKNFQFSPTKSRVLDKVGTIFNFQSNPNNQNSKLQINEKIALLSAFLIATSFWHILFSRIGFRAIMAPFFLVWGVFLLLKSLNQTKNNFQSNFNIIIYSILGGLFFGLGFHTYIAYRATPLLALIVIALYWFRNRDPEGVLQGGPYGAGWQIRKKIIFIAILFSFFTFIAAAPLGLYFLKNPQDFFGRTTQISIFNSESPIKNLSENILKTAGMFNFSSDYNWRHNYAGKPLLFWPVGIMFLIGIGILIRRLFSGEFSSSVILFSWLIITTLPVIISNEGLPHALRAILMAPAIFIFAGFGGIWLYEYLKSQISNLKNTQKFKILNFTLSFYILIFIFFIWLIFNTYYAYFIQWGKNSEVAGAFNQNYIDISRQLNALPKELPKYVIVKSGGVDVRGVPMPAQTVMFITDTFTPEKQKEKNIFYILPNQTNQIPANSYAIEIN